MGDVTDFLSGKFAKQNGEPANEYAVVSDFTRLTSTHAHKGNICSHVFHTYNGRLMYSLAYNTYYMTSATAAEYVRIIADVMQSLL
ncbi:uncharacterized protein LOC125179094 [Hyalella azteca]|uniref:Uncharacterized protein LOC125179094 n=1 Tax=Hyalella azteca TaxID=294128 RepID=A0A979FVY6_HYAAZ|nr:uncharacterized protein LOC125179094 [Hyalella azteca]